MELGDESVAGLRCSKQGPAREVTFRVRAVENWKTLGRELQQNGKVDLDT